MPIRTIKVLLTLEDRKRLEAIVKASKTPNKDKQKAKGLLLTDVGEFGPQNLTKDVADKLGLSERSVGRIREAYAKNSSIDHVFRFANLSDQRRSKVMLENNDVQISTLSKKKTIQYIEIDHGENESFLMENVKCRVTLNKEERAQLESILKAGKQTARQFNRARILLLADEGVEGPALSDIEIADKLNVSISTVARVRRLLMAKGQIDDVLKTHHHKAGRHPKIDGEIQAKLIAQVCSKPPEGRCKWTLRLLADELVKLEVIDSISHTAVANALKKTNLNPGNEKEWIIPPETNGDFVAAMEDVLEVYSRPYDPQRPVVCMDEMNKQCIKEIRKPISLSPGNPERYDSEYERNGNINIFLASEPLKGHRLISVTERRTKIDWAHFIKDVVDNQYSNALKIVLIMDNLNTHHPGSLYEAFEPEEARRLINKLEIHYTPKHGSWLNVAEIELSVLSSQCLNRRIPDKETYKREIEAWNNNRNNQQVGVEWHFATKDARIKLKRLYPKIITKDINVQ